MGLRDRLLGSASIGVEAVDPALEAGELQDLAVALLLRHYEQLRVPVHRQGRSITIGRGTVTCELRLRDIQAGAVVIEYSIRCPRLDPRPIEQPLAYWDDDHRQAIVRLVHIVADNVLEPILRAAGFHGHGRPVRHLRSESWTPEGHRIWWDIYLGTPFVFGTSNHAVLKLDARLQGTLLMDTIASGIHGLMAEPRFHWFKVYAGSLGDGALTGDVWLDDCRAEAEFERVRALDLPTDVFLFCRQFGVLVPFSGVAPPAHA